MTSQPRTVHVPYTLEQDEDGIWCAHAWLGSSEGANGNGATPDEAIADLREAVQMVIDEDDIPEQLERLSPAELAELLEDFADAAAAREARTSIEAGEPLIPWEQVKTEAGL
jgi:predicted RNase H-like HicB family nuclease